MAQNQSQLLVIHAGERLTTTTESLYSSKIPFFMRLGRGGGMLTQDTPDILDLLGTKYFNDPSATWLLWRLIKSRDTNTNICVVRGSDLTVAEKARLLKGYKTLFDDNVILRLKREYYLINPNLVLPTNATFESILDSWIAQGGKV